MHSAFVKLFMSSPRERLINIEFTVATSNPQLLAGLDAWLELGLISPEEVEQLCQDLVCPIKQPQTRLAAIATPVKSPIPPQFDFITPVKPPVDIPPQFDFIAGILQSLKAELSVRWLLFLGMFLVVVSSGVLAATQWQRFPGFAQYGVLFAYTLSFFWVSSWATRQQNLKFTAQTLLIVTLLLVPVNFWAMDSFKLWHNPFDWLVVAAATVTLTTTTFLLGKNRLLFTKPNQKLSILNILGLGYLHWGWEIPGFPLIALYIAMVGTSLIAIYQKRQPLTSPISEDESNPQNKLNISLPALLVVYALIVLLVRGIFVVHLDVQQLGLAIGICGWLVTWVAPRSATSRFWDVSGSCLLFLGWLVTIPNYPSQAIAVSGLSLWFLTRRLQRYGLKVDLTAILIIGLQTIWLCWRLVPLELQQWAQATGIKLTNAQQPELLLSVALFPYIFFMVVLSDRFRQGGKRELATFGELLTLGLGSLLTTIASLNPTLRSLNLLLSTVTLIFVTRRRTSTSPPLIYLTHITGVVTLLSIVNWRVPALNLELWATLLLTLTVAEWLFSVGEGVWRRSAWHIGWGLAIFSYFILQQHTVLNWRNIPHDYWGIIWLVTPLTLTAIASRTSAPRRQTIITLSVAALGMAELLTLPIPEVRLIGLGVATALMIVNTNYLRSKISAEITIGFGLGLIGVLCWEGVFGLHLTIAGWFFVTAIAILCLWLVAQLTPKERDTEGEVRSLGLAAIYSTASDRWAIALCGFELLVLTLHSIAVYQRLATPEFLSVMAIMITLSAIAYRSWRQPTNFAFYGIGWCLELLSAELLGFGEISMINIAIANIALGLFTQLLGEWWQRRHSLERLPSSLHILPLTYAAFSVIFRSATFASWTGWCSLGVALIAIGVGRRHESFKPLLYLGIAGVSISAYEILFYQLRGGELGLSLIALSTLGATIMYAYRIFSPWLINYLRLNPQELQLIAHIHWILSSCLLMAANITPITSNHFVGLATGVFLIRYAIFQGRRATSSLHVADIWIYLGAVEVVGVSYLLRDTAIGHYLETLQSWSGAFACVIAYFLYILPWETWGWYKAPWQRIAYILPLLFLVTQVGVYPISLAIAAAYYIFLAKASNQFRFTYLSVMLIDWALLRYGNLYLTDSLWYVTLIGLSLLYVAQFEPYLKLPQQKNERHYLRAIASGLICGWAIVFHQDSAIIPGIFGLFAIFAGLALRVRAFLYIGTAAFLVTGFYQLVILILHYPFLKWVVGLLVGIVLISIAANFEKNRDQLSSVLRNTGDRFQEWE